MLPCIFICKLTGGPKTALFKYFIFTSGAGPLYGGRHVFFSYLFFYSSPDWTSRQVLHSTLFCLFLFNTFCPFFWLVSLCSPFSSPPLVDIYRLTVVVVSWRGAHSTVNLPGPPGTPGPALTSLVLLQQWLDSRRSVSSLGKVSLLLCQNP